MWSSVSTNSAIRFKSKSEENILPIRNRSRGLVVESIFDFEGITVLRYYRCRMTRVVHWNTSVDASLAFKRYQFGSNKKPQKRWLRIKSEIEQAGLFFHSQQKKHHFFFGNSLKFEIQERLLILYMLPNDHLIGAACASPKAHMGGRKRRRKSAGEGLCALLLPEDLFGKRYVRGCSWGKKFPENFL